MKVKRNNLTDELMPFQQNDIVTPTKKPINLILINYEEIIEKQSQMIESLYKQCTFLRQRINKFKNEQIFSSENKNMPKQNMQKFAEVIQKEMLKQIASILQIGEQEYSKIKIFQIIKRWRWQRNKKAEPIFIERIKQVRIPVPVEKIVEKIVQKIVIQQKIIQTPIFRQKIVQKFISKIEESNESILPQISKISSQEKQTKQNLRKTSDDSFILGTNSIIKQNSNSIKQKQIQNHQISKLGSKSKHKDENKPKEIESISKNINTQEKVSKSQIYRYEGNNKQNTLKNYKNANIQKEKTLQCQFYRPQSQSHVLKKKPSLRQLNEDNSSTVNRTFYEKNGDSYSKSYINGYQKSGNINTTMRSPKNSNNNYPYVKNQNFKEKIQKDRYDERRRDEDRYEQRKYYDKYENKGTKNYEEYSDDSEQDSYQYPNRNRNNSNKNDRTYYKNSQDRSKVSYSPKNMPKQQNSIYDNKFDKNKFLDSSKINQNKNIKKREKYDFYDTRQR